MKNGLLLLSFIASILCLPAYAQAPHPSMADLHKRDSAMFAHPHNMHPGSVAKTTNTTASRLIARSYVGSGGEGTATFGLQDSTSYSYSSGRGGDLMHTLDYDITYTYDTTATTPESMGTQTFDANNNVLTTAFAFWNYTSNAFVNDIRYVYTYDGNNNATIEEIQVWDSAANNWSNNYRQLRTYDGNNNYVEILVEGWNDTASVWDTSEMFTYTYTGTNETSALAQTWNGTTWVPYNLDTATYDVNNNQLTEVSQVWTAGAWVNSFQLIYTYDAMNDQLTALEQLWNPGWINFSLDNYSGFVAQQPQVDSSLQYNTTTTLLANNIRHVYTYNSYNQETLETQQQWNDTTASWRPAGRLYNYYYQTYTLAVNPVSNTGGSARIYPVPAQDVLHISLTWDVAQASSIAIYDVQGRILRHWQVPATTTYNSAISVSDLAEGNYFISITGAKGQIVQKLVVSK